MDKNMEETGKDLEFFPFEIVRTLLLCLCFKKTFFCCYFPDVEGL